MPLGREIRLVVLKVSHSEGQVLAFLNIVSLDSEPYYEAISYVWGTPVTQPPSCSMGVGWHVTSNLGTVLHSLAICTGEMIYWVDALCIHQTNFERARPPSQLNA
jgi:hypothetical protein